MNALEKYAAMGNSPLAQQMMKGSGLPGYSKGGPVKKDGYLTDKKGKPYARVHRGEKVVPQKKKEASTMNALQKYAAKRKLITKLARVKRDWAFGKGHQTIPNDPPPQGVAMTPRHPQVPIVDPNSSRIFSHRERNRLQSLPKKRRGPSWKDTEPANQQPGMPDGPVLRPKTDTYFWSGKGGGKYAQ